MGYIPPPPPPKTDQLQRLTLDGCEYCGSEHDKRQCPNCGAPRRRKK